MTLTPLVVVGAAGTGRETLDIVEAINAESPRFALVGVLDDYPSDLHLSRLADRETPYLGTTRTWLDRSRDPVAFVVAIAAPAVREKLAAVMAAAGHRPAMLVHPRAIIGSRTRIGEGAIVYGGAQISTNVTTGAHLILNMNACIGHDCVLGSAVSINPGATISGEARLEDRVLVGGRATVLQGVTLGPDAIVGAAALVTKDVPGAATVKGVPGRWDPQIHQND